MVETILMGAVCFMLFIVLVCMVLILIPITMDFYSDILHEIRMVRLCKQIDKEMEEEKRKESRK